MEAGNVFKRRKQKIKARASKKGIEVDPNLDKIIEHYFELQKGKCFYTGKQMLLDATGSDKFLAMSIDRLDDQKGYTFDNIVLCCNIVNLMKNKLKKDEFLSFCKEVALFHSGFKFGELQE